MMPHAHVHSTIQSGKSSGMLEDGGIESLVVGWGCAGLEGLSRERKGGQVCTLCDVRLCSVDFCHKSIKGGPWGVKTERYLLGGVTLK